MCLCAVLGPPMSVLGNSDELGQAPGRFWGSGLLGGGNRKNKGSEAESGLSLAAGKWQEMRLGISVVGPA